jgi:hypothetical protein
LTAKRVVVSNDFGSFAALRMTLNRRPHNWG